MLNAWKTEKHTLYVLGQFDFMVFPILSAVVGRFLAGIYYWYSICGGLLKRFDNKSQRLSWLFWIIIAYVAGNTVFIYGNYVWFFFSLPISWFIILEFVAYVLFMFGLFSLLKFLLLDNSWCFSQSKLRL